MRSKGVQRRDIYVSERVVGRRRKVDASVAVFGGIRSGRCCEGKARLNGRQDFDVDLFRAGAGLRGSVHVSDRTTDGSLNADSTVKVPQGPLAHASGNLAYPLHSQTVEVNVHMSLFHTEL